METRTSGSAGGLGKRNACKDVNAPQPDPTRPRSARPLTRVESAWGAVSALPPVRLPRPLAEPGVRLSPHRALHGRCCQALVHRVQGLGIVLPRYR